MDKFTIGELAVQYVSLGGTDPRAHVIAEKVRREDPNPLLMVDTEAGFLQVNNAIELMGR